MWPIWVDAILAVVVGCGVIAAIGMGAMTIIDFGWRVEE